MQNDCANYEPVAWWFTRRRLGRALREEYEYSDEVPPKLLIEQDLSGRIRERAYEIWIASGYRDDKADQHWLTAEREILSALQSAAAVKAPAKRIRGRTIRPFLARYAFEPEAVRNMSLAFDSVCEALGLRIRENPATKLVAEKVIELAQRGVRDVATLRVMTLKELKREE